MRPYMEGVGRREPSALAVKEESGMVEGMSARSYFTRGAGMMPWTEEGPARETRVRATGSG